MGAIIVVDALWGDSGKGKVAGYLSRRENASLCVRAGIGTNAGHSVYLSEQDVIRTRQLPLGFADLTPHTEWLELELDGEVMLPRVPIKSRARDVRRAEPPAGRLHRHRWHL